MFIDGTALGAPTPSTLPPDAGPSRAAEHGRQPVVLRHRRGARPPSARSWPGRPRVRGGPRRRSERSLRGLARRLQAGHPPGPPFHREYSPPIAPAAPACSCPLHIVHHRLVDPMFRGIPSLCRGRYHLSHGYALQCGAVNISFHMSSPDTPPFEDMPPPVREFLAGGFSHLAGLSSASLDAVAAQVSRWLDPKYPQRTDTIASDLKLDVGIINALLPSLSLLASSLFSNVRPISLDGFVTAATAAGVLKEDHVPAVRAFGGERLERHRASIRDAIARGSASLSVMPSYQGFEATIDLRVATVEEDRIVTMPMAIVALTTDMKDKNLVLQMTPRDVDEFIRQLTSVAQKFSHCDKMTTVLATSDPPHKG